MHQLLDKVRFSRINLRLQNKDLLALLPHSHGSLQVGVPEVELKIYKLVKSTSQTHRQAYLKFLLLFAGT